MQNFLQSFNVLNNNEIDEFIQLSTKVKLNRSDYFIRAGDICKEVAFVLSGTLRSFYISEKGDDFTYCITFPNNLVTAYSSFITGELTTENIQAITAVELLVIPKKAIDNLVLKNVNWLKFLKVIAEQQYIELEKRVFQLQKDSAKIKYAQLIKNQSKYIKEIPLQYLASYLGISQRHLSRIRKEVNF